MAFILVREICADLNLHYKTRALHIGVVKFTSFHDAHVLLFRCILLQKLAPNDAHTQR